MKNVMRRRITLYDLLEADASLPLIFSALALSGD